MDGRGMDVGVHAVDRRPAPCSNDALAAPRAADAPIMRDPRPAPGIAPRIVL